MRSLVLFELNPAQLRTAKLQEERFEQREPFKFDRSETICFENRSVSKTELQNILVKSLKSKRIAQ